MPTQGGAFFYDQLVGPAIGGGLLINSAEVERIKTDVIGSAPFATILVDAFFGAVVYYTANAGANWTTNLTWSTGTPLNAYLRTGQSQTFVVKATQGSTAYYNTAVQVDGTAVTAAWIGGAPTAGTANGVDAYSYQVSKTGDRTFKVLASVGKAS
jgi:hypothetical protein